MYSTDEILRKIGRNIILFQQLEQLLKYLCANGNISGFASKLQDNIEKRKASIHKQTMGQLVGQYINNVNPELEDLPAEPEEIEEAYFTFKFSIECDAVYFEKKKEALANVVSERNQLVHHLLPQFDLSDPESCKTIGIRLDDQSEKIRDEIKDLKAIVKTLYDGKKKLSKFFASEEGKKQFKLSFLQQSRLVILLGEIAIQTARPDGWALMSVAGQLIRQHAPEEIALLKERYNHNSLKSLILATELFDLYEEATKKGGIRVLYRLKSGWKLSHA
jgi:hypothetical protein